MNNEIPVDFSYPVGGIVLMIISYGISLLLTFCLIKGRDESSLIKNALVLQVIWWISSILSNFIPYIGLLAWVWVPIFFMVWKAASKEQIQWAKYAFYCYFINLFVSIWMMIIVGSAVWNLLGAGA